MVATNDSAHERPIPRDLSKVTGEWLERALRRRYPTLEIRGFRVASVLNGHTTKMRIELDLNDAGTEAGIPSRLCLKANWSEGFDSGNICELEARFYHELRAQLNVPAPRAYYSEWDGTGQGLVVLEDLAVDGALFGHTTHHLGVERVAQVLANLARLHGTLWDHRKLAELAWLPTSMATPIDCDQLRMLYPLVERNLARREFAAFVPHWLPNDAERFLRAFDALGAYERKQGPARCLLHGDAHIGNSYIRPNGDWLWIDWQLVRRGHPWRDVCYFMVGALTIEERREHERPLLDHYLECLASTGAKDIPTPNEFWQHYRRWALYGLTPWLSYVDDWGQAGLPIAERFCAAVTDLDTLALLESQA
jgi:hypothetical protein